MKKEVKITAETVLPNVCCLCLAASTEAIEARHSRFIPLGPAVHVTSSAVAIPFCEEHAKLVRRKMRYCKAAMITFLILGCGTGFILKGFNLWDSHPILMLPLFTFIALAIFFGFHERRQLPVRLKSPKAEGEKFMGTSKLVSAVLVCDKSEFANAVAGRNEALSNKNTEPDGS